MYADRLKIRNLHVRDFQDTIKVQATVRFRDARTSVDGSPAYQRGTLDRGLVLADEACFSVHKEDEADPPGNQRGHEADPTRDHGPFG